MVILLFSDFDICRFYFPPGSPYSSSLYCVPLLGFMVSAGFKIQSYCLLFSIDKYIAFCNFAFGQIHFSIQTNAFCNLDKYSRLYCRVAKCQFFTQIKIWVQNFTPKTRNSQLICFCDKMRKSCSIRVIVGLVCYVRRPIEYLHRIWVECKCGWVNIIPLK